MPALATGRGTPKQAVAQGRASPVVGAGPVSLSSKCGKGWVHIVDRTTSPSDDRPIGGHTSAQAHPSRQPNRHHRQRPVRSPTSQCPVYLTMSLKSDLRTNRVLTDCSPKQVMHNILLVGVTRCGVHDSILKQSESNC